MVGEELAEVSQCDGPLGLILYRAQLTEEGHLKRSNLRVVLSLPKKLGCDDVCVWSGCVEWVGEWSVRV